MRGRLGPFGSDAEIGLVNSSGRSAQAGAVGEARRSGHQAIVLLTAGSRPGLFLLNAGSFTKPSGPRCCRCRASKVSG
jgi:hypothetical protein